MEQRFKILPFNASRSNIFNYSLKNTSNYVYSVNENKLLETIGRFYRGFHCVSCHCLGNPVLPWNWPKIKAPNSLEFSWNK